MFQGIFRLTMVGGLALLVTACASSWSTSNVNRSGASAAGVSSRSVVGIASIVVTEEDIVDRPYRALGDINVTVNKTTLFNADPTPAMVDEKLREEAHGLGADAVILVRYGSVGVGLLSWGSLDGKGRAVVFTD